MAIALDISDKSAQLIFNPVVGAPFILSAFSEKDIIEFDNLELADAAVGADGTMMTWVKPGIVVGRVKLIATAPVVNALTTFTNQQNQIGFSLLGSMFITNPGWATSYINWIWTSGFAGYTLKENNQPLTWGFKAEIPDVTTLTGAAAIAQALAGL